MVWRCFYRYYAVRVQVSEFVHQYLVPTFWHGENTPHQLVGCFFFFFDLQLIFFVTLNVSLENNMCLWGSVCLCMSVYLKWTFIWKCRNRCGWVRTFQFLSYLFFSCSTSMYLKMFRHVTQSVTTSWWKISRKLFISFITASAGKPITTRTIIKVQKRTSAQSDEFKV